MSICTLNHITNKHKVRLRAGPDCCRHHPFLASWWPLSIHSDKTVTWRGIETSASWELSARHRCHLSLPRKRSPSDSEVQHGGRVTMAWHWKIGLTCLTCQDVVGFWVPILEPGHVLLLIPHFLLRGNCACYKGSSIISIDDMKWKYVKSAPLPTPLLFPVHSPVRPRLHHQLPLPESPAKHWKILKENRRGELHAVMHQRRLQDRSLKKGLPPNSYSTASLQTKEHDIKVIDKWTGVLWERLLWWFGWWQKWPRGKDQRALERPAHDRHSRCIMYENNISLLSSIFHISIKVVICKLTSIDGQNQWLYHPTCHSL